jgi:hypothetical protein
MNDVIRLNMKQEDIEFALDMYDKYLFWDFSPAQCRYLTPEFVVPRVVRYGTLSDVMRLFAIYPRGVMRTVLEKDRELDQTERAFLTMVNEAITAG